MVGEMLVNDEEFIARIRKIFDLNLYEAKVWISLLSKGVATAGELSEISGIPRSRSYDILESLERKGFVVMKLGKPVKYIAVPPEEVLERFKVRLMEEAREKINAVEKLKNSDLLSKLNNLYKQSIKYQKLDEFAGAVRGRVNIITALENAFKNAKSTIEVLVNDNLKDLAHILQALKKIKKGNVKVKILVPRTKGMEEIIKQLKSVGEVRIAPKDVNGRFVIIDGNKVFMLMKETGIDSGIWVNSEELGKPLSVMFKHLWSNAKK